ncbi:GTP cyclohydrolase II family protein [Aspergillus niger]|uniref:GTP cyclohydrolase II family protein n=1 Tax=Aspergillus niger TaxID=5061 RepID=A0A505HU79_ASPNG|nr:GTP cyclohydrolase II family protein [Aspergillus niger]
MAPRKPRCNFKECKEAAQRIAHACTGLEDCKKESHARNADKLNSERTHVIKGV